VMEAGDAESPTQSDDSSLQLVDESTAQDDCAGKDRQLDDTDLSPGMTKWRTRTIAENCYTRGDSDVISFHVSATRFSPPSCG